MIESLKIGELVYDRLKSLVSNRCYPIVAENGTNYPFIVYERSSVLPRVCKDGIYEDEVSMSIKVISPTYNESVDIAQDVREQMTFNSLHYPDNDGYTYSSTLTSADEVFQDNVYVQSLYFKININN